MGKTSRNASAGGSASRSPGQGTSAKGKSSSVLPYVIVAIVAIAVLATVAWIFIGRLSMPGSDRDAHGCILSAGYSWCEATQKCYRSFEEGCASAASQPIAPKRAVYSPPQTMIGVTGKNISQQQNAPSGINAASVPASGAEQAAKCSATQGYIWCAALQKCVHRPDESCAGLLAPWELAGGTQPMPANNSSAAGAQNGT